MAQGFDDLTVFFIDFLPELLNHPGHCVQLVFGPAFDAPKGNDLLTQFFLLAFPVRRFPPPVFNILLNLPLTLLIMARSGLVASNLLF